MGDVPVPDPSENTPRVEAKTAAQAGDGSKTASAGTLMDSPAPESLREILETPVVADFVQLLREASATQTDVAKRQVDRTFELQKRQLELHAALAERDHQFEVQQLELAAAHSRWVRWLVVGVLIGLAALFVGFRDRPEVALDIAKGLAALGGAVGIGWSLRKAPSSRGDKSQMVP